MANYTLAVACSPYNNSDQRNIRVQIKCLPNYAGDEGVDMDAAVFAYRYIDGEFLFDHVCSTVDMVEYPLYDDLVNGESFKWCRKDVVDILVRALSIAEDFIDEVKSDVNMLYQNMLAHNRLVGTGNYLIGKAYYITVDQDSANNEVTTVPLNDTCTVNQPTKGTITITRDTYRNAQVLQYTPNEGEYGKDEFMYTIIDVDNSIRSYTVFVDIKLINNISVSQELEDFAGDIDITWDIGSITDVVDDEIDTDPLNHYLDTTKEWDINIYDQVSDNHGEITKVNNSTLHYTPATEFTGFDSFTYTVTDGKRYATILCQFKVINE